MANASYETLTLPIVQFAVEQAISRRDLAYHVNAEVFLRDVSDHLVMVLRAELASDKVRDETIRYPANWFEAFKQRWFPTWILKRFPVLETVHHYEAMRVFPEFRYPKQLGREVRIITHRSWPPTLAGAECL